MAKSGHNPHAAIMPLGDHLEELRKRIILSLLGLVPIFIVSLIAAKPLLGFVVQPVRKALLAADQPPQMLATNFVETFAIYFYLAFVLTVIVGSPWLLYQLWRFVSPGLYLRERRFVYFLIPLSSVLTISGVAFLYFAMLPIVLSFFIGFGTGIADPPARTAPAPEGMVFPQMPVLDADPESPEPGAMWFNTRDKSLRIAVPDDNGGVKEVLGTQFQRRAVIAQQYRISEYTKSFLTMTLGFSIGFQTPVVVLLLGWVGIVKRSVLARFRKQIAMGSLVLSALLTPADPFSMILLAVPLYLLFELGSLLLWLFPASRIAGDDNTGREPDGEA
ncbi:MAG: twin-arginine translocase subunit TatC [Planctomycetota bacterium]